MISQTNFTESPQVTIIMPIRNEAGRIMRCLDAVSTQDYPRRLMEILVVDGMSEDGTREIVQMAALKDARIQLLDNPNRIVSTALNHGIQAARGIVVIRVDGHTVIPHDYVRLCIDGLRTIRADCVGGVIQTVGETTRARAISLALSSPIGVGNATFRYATTPGYVDTLAFGAYRREIFDQIGLFDEELVRNQDDEFNFRLTRAGGQIWLDPTIRSLYYSRSSFKSLWRQYYEYGFWKVRVIQKHRRPASWRHLVPALFMLSLIASLGLSVLFQTLFWFASIVVPYFVLISIASLWIASKRSWYYAPLLPLAFSCLHIAYGTGFLWGTIRWGLYGIKSLPIFRTLWMK